MASRFWVGGTGTWDQTSTTHWSSTSGGATGASIPTASDDVFFDANSGSGTCTVSVAAPCNSLNTSGSSLHALTVNASINIGSATAGASNVALDLTGITTYSQNTSGSVVLNFVSTSATVQTVNFNSSITVGTVTFNGAGGSWKLVAGMTQNTANTFTLTAGSLDTNGQTCSWGAYASSGSATRSLTLGTSTITITGSGASPWAQTSTGVTISAASSTINLTHLGTVAQTVTFNTFTYGTVNMSAPAGSSTISFTGAPTFGSLNITGPITLSMTAGSTKTVTNFSARGSSGNLVTITSATAGTAWTLSKASGTVQCDWLSLKDSAATGGATFYAGANSTNVSGNSGWTFTAPPGTAQSLSQASGASVLHQVLRSNSISQAQTVTRTPIVAGPVKAMTQPQSLSRSTTVVPATRLTSILLLPSSRAAVTKGTFTLSQGSAVAMSSLGVHAATFSRTQGAPPSVTRSFVPASARVVSQGTTPGLSITSSKSFTLTGGQVVTMNAVPLHSPASLNITQGSVLTNLHAFGHVHATTQSSAATFKDLPSIIPRLIAVVTPTVNAISSRRFTTSQPTTITRQQQRAYLRTLTAFSGRAVSVTVSNRGYAKALSTTQSQSTLVAKPNVARTIVGTQSTSPIVLRNIRPSHPLVPVFNFTITRRANVGPREVASVAATISRITRVNSVHTIAGQSSTTSVSHPFLSVHVTTSETPIALAHSQANRRLVPASQGQVVHVTPAHGSLLPVTQTVVPRRLERPVRNLTAAQATTASARRINRHTASAVVFQTALQVHKGNRVLRATASNHTLNTHAWAHPLNVTQTPSPSLIRSRQRLVLTSQGSNATRTGLPHLVPSPAQSTSASFLYRYNLPLMGQVWLPAPDDVLLEEYGDVYVIGNLPDFQFVLNDDEIPTLNLGPRVRMVPLDPTRVK